MEEKEIIRLFKERDEKLLYFKAAIIGIPLITVPPIMIFIPQILGNFMSESLVLAILGGCLTLIPILFAIFAIPFIKKINDCPQCGKPVIKGGTEYKVRTHCHNCGVRIRE